MSVYDQLIDHEGYRNLPYEDSLGHLTIGVGHNLSKPLSDKAILQILEDDIQDAKNDLDRVFSDWLLLTPARQNALVDMMFNLGLPRFNTFKKMIVALYEEDYETAADEMLDSKWATQVGHRAYTLSEMMRHG